MGLQSMNKKGNIPDLVFILVILFIFAMFTFIGFKIYSAYSESVMDDPMFNTTRGNIIDDAGHRALAVMDYAFIFIFIGLILSTIILGFQIRTHPIFFFLSLLALVVVIILGAQFSDIFTDFSDSDNMAGVASNYIIIMYVMNNLPLFLLFAGIAIMVIFYAKGKFMEG